MVVVSAVAVGMVVIVGVPMVMMPVMMMVMAVSVGGFAPGVAAQEQGQPEHRDGDARAERDPGVEALRDDVVRGIDGRRPQEIDTRGVRRRDDEPEEQRMPGGPARADEVRRDDRLAVARVEAVQGGARRSTGAGIRPANRRRAWVPWGGLASRSGG